MAVLVQAKNNTAGTITYTAEGVTITAGATVTIPNTVLIKFAADLPVILDILTGNIQIGDGTTLYNGLSALDLLKTSIALLPVLPLIASSSAAGNVGVTSAQVVAANTSRTGLIAINTSSGFISLGVGTTAVLYSGITLYPGGSWCMDKYSFTTDAINAIASVASSNLAVQEFTS